MNAEVEHSGVTAKLWQAALDADNSYRRLAAGCLCLLLAALFAVQFSSKKGPPHVREAVPFVTNTYQFLADNSKFMKKAIDALKNSNIAKFYLGGIPVYLVTGVRNTQAIFGLGTKVGGEDLLTQNVFPRLYKMPPRHVSRFTDDKSGRGRVPAPGHEGKPSEERFWHQYEHYHTEFLLRSQYTNSVVEVFRRQFTEALNMYPVGKTSTMNVKDFCRTQVTEMALRTLLGPSMFELNPDFLDTFWEFDRNISMLVLGPPRWAWSRPYKAQDRYLSMIDKYAKSAFQKFDWDGPSKDTPWEPHFGARVCREVARWLRDGHFTDETVAAGVGMLIFAQNTNSIPTVMWIIIELARDPSLFQAVREEVAECWATDPETGERVLDIQKVSTSPLIQSIWTETLRVRTDFNVLRHVKEPFELDGVKFRKGNMVQVPMVIAHMDEKAWGAEGHPASGFWAERHIKYVEQVDETGKKVKSRSFAMAARPTSFFPFGGGASICPGRNFAKHQVAVMIGLIVSKFDIEKIEWCKPDGSPSDRPAENDLAYSGIGAMPPDREMKITWKRIA